MGRKTLGSLAVAFALLLSASALSAQAVRVGGQVSLGDDFDFGIGPRLGFELPAIASGLWVVTTFDYFFPDQGPLGSDQSLDYWELNGNLLYEIELPSESIVMPYFGGGINFARVSVDDGAGESSSDSNLGLNLIGGLNFPLAGFNPFIELRLQIEGGEQFVIAGGITFP